MAVRILTVERSDGLVIAVGDTIKFLKDGPSFSKDEFHIIQKFENDGRLFFYSNNRLLSTDDERYTVIKKLPDVY